MAQEGNPRAVALPRPLLTDASLNFSFSGLKTAMLNRITKHPVSVPGAEANDLCASFQQAVCDVLVAKTAAALERTGVKRLVVAGGVACNSGLRRSMQALASKLSIDLRIPSPSLCGDNAAMLAVPGNHYLEQGHASELSMDVTATWDMDRVGDGGPSSLWGRTSWLTGTLWRGSSAARPWNRTTRFWRWGRDGAP